MEADFSYVYQILFRKILRVSQNTEESCIIKERVPIKLYFLYHSLLVNYCKM